ncbi:hypothetical protein JHK85_050259 [Glycine max]|nr:hypothetical protein JHK85_050259 [Glycine max]
MNTKFSNQICLLIETSSNIFEKQQQQQPYLMSDLENFSGSAPPQLKNLAPKSN